MRERERERGDGVGAGVALGYVICKRNKCTRTGQKKILSRLIRRCRMHQRNDDEDFHGKK